MDPDEDARRPKGSTGDGWRAGGRDERIGGSEDGTGCGGVEGLGDWGDRTGGGGWGHGTRGCGGGRMGDWGDGTGKSGGRDGRVGGRRT